MINIFNKLGRPALDRRLALLALHGPQHFHDGHEVVRGLVGYYYGFYIIIISIIIVFIILCCIRISLPYYHRIIYIIIIDITLFASNATFVVASRGWRSISSTIARSNLRPASFELPPDFSTTAAQKGNALVSVNAVTWCCACTL